MKPLLYIFGDSFSSEHNDQRCWINLLRQNFIVENYSQRGISEYRIWKNYKQYQKILKDDAKILFCHTSPHRLYLKDCYFSTSRSLKTHPFCDIILEDIYSKKEKTLIKTVETIWDDEYIEDHFNLVLNDLLRANNSFHITFFNLTADLLNLHSLWTDHRGEINHLNDSGNSLVAEKITNLILSF